MKTYQPSHATAAAMFGGLITAGRILKVSGVAVCAAGGLIVASGDKVEAYGKDRKAHHVAELERLREDAAEAKRQKKTKELADLRRLIKEMTEEIGVTDADLATA